MVPEVPMYLHFEYYLPGMHCVKIFALIICYIQAMGDVHFTRRLTVHLVKGLVPRTSVYTLSISIVAMVVLY